MATKSRTPRLSGRPHRRGDENCSCNACLKQAYGYDWRDLVPGSGWLYDYMHWALEVTDAPPIYLVASGLFCLAMSVGSNCVFRPAPNIKSKILNMWILIAGSSSKQRKSTAVNLAREILCMHWAHHFVPGLGSPEAIFSAISAQPQCGMLLPEFPSFLEQMRMKYAQSLKTTLMDLYDGKTTEGRTTRGRGTERIVDPRFNMLGGAAFTLLDNHISDKDFRSGFLSRMFFVADDRQIRQQDEMAFPKELKKLQSDLFKLTKWAAGRKCITASTGGKDALDRLCLEIEERCDGAGPEYEPLLYRAQDQAKKIAALYAATVHSTVYESLVEERVAPLIRLSLDAVEEYLIGMMSDSAYIRAAHRIKDWLVRSRYKKDDWIPFKEIVLKSKDVKHAHAAVDQLEGEEVLSSIKMIKCGSQEKATRHVGLLVGIEELIPRSRRR